jgi:hypothetical protein
VAALALKTLKMLPLELQVAALIQQMIKLEEKRIQNKEIVINKDKRNNG